MKKLTDRLLTATADVALEALIAAAGFASMGGIYQPKETKNLKKVAANRKAKSTVNR